jgi:hypothetical protein
VNLKTSIVFSFCLDGQIKFQPRIDRLQYTPTRYGGLGGGAGRGVSSGVQGRYREGRGISGLK